MESKLDIVKLSRINYLKQKMRKMLEAEIGDTPDNLADAIRAIVLSDAIRLGIVTNQETIDKHTKYISTMLEGYGGGGAIADTLLSNLTSIYQQIVQGYFIAKSSILLAETEEDVRRIDLPGDIMLENIV